MNNIHWRYNFNTQQFECIKENVQQHYYPLLRHVHVPTLVIDIYLVPVKNLNQYICEVIDQAHQRDIHFSQIIFDATLDVSENYSLITEVLNKFSCDHGIKCYLSLSQFSLKQHSHLIEINYPSWLFVFKTQIIPEMSTKDRTYKFSCLNRNPSWHRLLLYTLIKQSGVLDQFVYSFYDRCPYQGYKVTAAHYGILKNYADNALYQKCLSNIQDFPLSWNNEELGKNDHSIKHDAYYDTWCNVVTETSATISFTSEKIWKPIAAGQIFLIVGSPGTASWLNSLGINTFDSDYDRETDVVKRLTKVVEIIQEHVEDPRSWYMKNKYEIEHNHSWFLSGNIEKMLLEPIVTQLNHK